MFKLSAKMSTAVSWVFIVISIVLTQTPTYRNLKQASKESLPDFRFQFIGKYAVGMKYLFGQQAVFKKRLAQLEQDIQKFQGARKQLAILPIMDELSGRDAALLELKHIAENPDIAGNARDLPLFQQLYREGSASLNLQQRHALQQYGWVGQLALSQDRPDSDPERKTILQSAARMVILIALMTVGILMISVVGLILFIVAIVLGKKGKLHSRLVKPERPGNMFLESFAIYLTGFLAVPALIQILFPRFRAGAIVFAVAAVMVAILWPRFRGLKWRDYREALGWRRGEGLFREVGAGILGYVAGLPLLLAAAALIMILSRYAGEFPVHPIVNRMGNDTISILKWGFLACVWAPVVEETFFRGTLFSYMRMRLQWVVSGILSALIFAIIHPQGWVAVPALAAIGFNLSAIREWRGSIVASMSAHALNNGAALLFLIIAMS